MSFSENEEKEGHLGNLCLYSLFSFLLNCIQHQKGLNQIHLLLLSPISLEIPTKLTIECNSSGSTVGPRTTLILGTRKISVFRKQCIVDYYIVTSKNHVSAKFLHTLYTIKSVYTEFLEPIKNRVSAKSVLKEAVYNEALLYHHKKDI